MFRSSALAFTYTLPNSRISNPVCIILCYTSKNEKWNGKWFEFYFSASRSLLMQEFSFLLTKEYALLWVPVLFCINISCLWHKLMQQTNLFIQLCIEKSKATIKHKWRFQMTFQISFKLNLKLLQESISEKLQLNEQKIRGNWSVQLNVKCLGEQLNINGIFGII